MAHENDHLHGHLYVEKVEGELQDVNYEALDEDEYEDDDDYDDTYEEEK